MRYKSVEILNNWLEIFEVDLRINVRNILTRVLRDLPNDTILETSRVALFLMNLRCNLYRIY